MKSLKSFGLVMVLALALGMGAGCAKKNAEVENVEPAPVASTSSALDAAAQQITDGVVYFDFDKYDIKAEYRDMLPQNAEKELLNGQFVPWFLPGDKLVFKKDKWVKKNKVSQYMLVDCKTGVQKELFDHRKLQVRLRRIGINYADGELPDIEPLSVDENGAVRFLMPGGDEYQFDDVRLQRIRKALPEAPAYSPDRRWAVTIRRNNLHLHDRKNGLAGRITKDGKPYNAYATRIGLL